MKRASIVLCCLASALLVVSSAGWAARARKPPAAAKPAAPVIRGAEAEARLIEVYKLIGEAKRWQALVEAEALVKDHPNFQLAQLAYGDLLASQARHVRALGDVPNVGENGGWQMLSDLRDESRLRMRALRERPPPGSVPAQFLQLAPRNKHAIAVDTSRSRLYLFENSAGGLKLLADYYISVGKSGIEKYSEGDLRTPLGVYFITSVLDPKSLGEFYGAGALPINYPNAYDARRGKTGSGIWLHGAPPTQFSRSPKATDGCIVLANADLQRIIATVEVRTTPVVIARRLQWVPAQPSPPDDKRFAEALRAWRTAKVGGDLSLLLSFYTPDASGEGKTLAEWAPQLKSELDKARGRDIALKDLSYLSWSDAAEIMVVTFGEVLSGTMTGRVKRQYWVLQGQAWKIFYEGVVS